MTPRPQRSPGTFAALRLWPGDDLMRGLEAARDGLGAPALAVATCVGSLSDARLRHAGRDAATRYDGDWEIVSLAGTLDPAHRHLHLSMADAEGRVGGGHLLGGTVRTTAEVVLVILDDLAFAREPCPRSGYDELVIRPR